MQEPTYFRARVRNRDLLVLINPETSELRKLSKHQEVRFVTDLKTKDTYWWDAYEALHDSIIQQLPINKHYRMGQAKFMTGVKQPVITHQVVR